MFVVAVAASVFFHQQFHISMTLGMRIKSALISALYRKVGVCVAPVYTQWSAATRLLASLDTVTSDPYTKVEVTNLLLNLLQPTCH